MSEKKLISLEPGSLWAKVKHSTERALQCGALRSIPTECQFIEQDGILFLVRILSNLDRKDADKKKQEKKAAASGKEFNPFLPYEEDLFVADISDTHVCILNKFNVVDYHLLIITRDFEEQESLLTLPDFAAMRTVLAEFDGLAFYNSGKVSGASQRHKHLQVVPLPLIPSGAKIPIDSHSPQASAWGYTYEARLSAKRRLRQRGLLSHSLEGVVSTNRMLPSIGILPAFDFAHAFARLDFSSAEAILDCYYTLLRTVNLLSDRQQLMGAYNLLATREWMLIVPRSQEHFESISINSLGFAGALLVRNEQQMQLLKTVGPMNVLKHVAKSC